MVFYKISSKNHLSKTHWPKMEENIIFTQAKKQILKKLEKSYFSRKCQKISKSSLKKWFLRVFLNI